MAGMFSTIFSSVGDGIQGIEDRVDAATDDMVAAGDAGAQQMDHHLQNAADRGEAGLDRMETRVDHVGDQISNSVDADIGVHVSFQASVHAESSGSYTDADGTGHDYGRSFDLDTGNTAIDQNLNLGETLGQAFDATSATMHGMSDGAFDALG